MSDEVTALTAAVDAENAAIFTYGVTTAFIGPRNRGTVAEFIAAHRVSRDQLNADLAAAHAPAAIPAAGYRLPTTVDDPESSATVLLDAEQTCARAYRALVEQASTPELRRRGAYGLTECARRAAHWRGALKQSPVTVAFPGAPGN